MRPNVLVVYKKSTYQRYVGRAQKRLEKLIENSDVSVEGLLREHEIHQETLKRAKQALRDLGARVEAAWKSRGFRALSRGPGRSRGRRGCRGARALRSGAASRGDGRCRP